MSGGGGGGADGGGTGPPALFVTEVVLEYHQMSFSPNKADFETGMEKVSLFLLYSENSEVLTPPAGR